MTRTFKQRANLAATALLGGGAMALGYLLTRPSPKVDDPQSLLLPLPLPVTVSRPTPTQLRFDFGRPAQRIAIYPQATPTPPIDRPSDDAPLLWQQGQPQLAIAAPATPTYYACYFDAESQPYMAAERIITLEGGFNFRDIGGYPTSDGRHTQWGRIYRAGQLSALTEADLQTLAALNIDLVCDLRTAPERADQPNRLPNSMQNMALSIFSDKEVAVNPLQLLLNLRRLDWVMLDSYTQFMLSQKAPAFGKVLTQLAAPGPGATLVHCTAGKDRTGLSMALLLSALGVDEPTILADYALTNLFYAQIRSTLLALESKLAILRLGLDDLKPLLLANPATLAGALAYLRQKYGSIEAYLLGPAQLSQASLSALRAKLLG
jgi:protein-tyrosine phosphatase